MDRMKIVSTIRQIIQKRHVEKSDKKSVLEKEAKETMSQTFVKMVRSSFRRKSTKRQRNKVHCFDKPQGNGVIDDVVKTATQSMFSHEEMNVRLGHLPEVIEKLKSIFLESFRIRKIPESEIVFNEFINDDGFMTLSTKVASIQLEYTVTFPTNDYPTLSFAESTFINWPEMGVAEQAYIRHVVEVKYRTVSQVQSELL